MCCVVEKSGILQTILVKFLSISETGSASVQSFMPAGICIYTVCALQKCWMILIMPVHTAEDRLESGVLQQ